MNWAMLYGIAAPYRRKELYGLWFKFKEDPDADKILADFMQSDRGAAQQLIEEFERDMKGRSNENGRTDCN